jgi:hypothetical protein
VTATIVTLALLGLTVVGPGGSTPPPVWGGGGPDAYGYRYIDSDTAGGPTYNWIDIRSVGEQVTGLGDDNIVGPFQIGFDFPYYWYTVSSFYLGSNGYIAFHDNHMNASPFPGVPSPARANNVIAPLLSDLNPEDSGTVHVYSNNTDTCIVQFTGVPFWAPGSGMTGANSFQIILTKADSSILVQYALQLGSPYNGWLPENAQVGIENVSGNVGLNYLSGATPPGNAIHPDLAVWFYPPESTNYQVHDAGVRNAMNDRNGGMSALRDRPLNFWAVAQNYGNQPESDFTSYVKVKRSSGSVLFFDSTMTSVPDPGDTDSIAFPNAWTPTTNGTYIIEVYTRMTGDANPLNDTAKVELQILTLPGTLTYDKGVADAYYSWNGPGGYGNRFVPPVYPCTVTAIRFNGQSATGVDCSFGIFDDNGPGGTPGDTWQLNTVNVSAPQWYVVNLSPAVAITDGAFFVGAMSSTASDPSFGMDTIAPFSGQGWEYTGVWAPSRDLWVRDPCFNAMISATGIEEWVGPAPVPMPVRIDVNPNPLGATARLKLVNPRGNETAVELYDATGSIIRTLELRNGAAVLDGRHLADGIYFCRVAGATSPVAKVVVSH